METFDSTKQSLSDLLAEIASGKIQLPDFQRGWVWDDDHVRSLLVSIARSFPVGAVMMLQTGGAVNFQVRPVEGVEKEAANTSPDKLILDGQQRLTSLTQAIATSSPVNTRTAKGKKIKRHYYFNINLALEGEEYLDQAVIAVDDDRRIRSNFGRDIELDLSTRELECQQLHFPCDQILNSDHWEQALHEHAPDEFSKYMEFRQTVINSFRNYQLPIIELKKETSKEAVCLVFEKVNTGGVSLSVFELVTASYAAEGYNLRDDWFGSELRSVDSRQERIAKDQLLPKLGSTEFLQAIALLYTQERKKLDLESGKSGKQVRPISVKRAAVLDMPLTAYKQWADEVEQGFRFAAQFLRKQCFFSPKDIPYSTQIVPLAAIMTVLGNRWHEPRIYEKLARWYWCGVLGELYGGAVETRVANDFEELQVWFENDNEMPRTVIDASFDPDRLDSLKSRLSAAYKGINVLVLREGALDFFWKDSVQDLDQQDIPLDIHHIFPKDWCKKQGIPAKIYDSIINKTPISYKANRKIGGAAPADYLLKIQGDRQVQSSDQEMNEILSTHFIEPETMRSNDFDDFWFTRKRNLVALIDSAVGKATSKDHDWIAQVDDGYKNVAEQMIKSRLPAPIIGLDLTDESGKVLLEAEMAWNESKVAVVDDEKFVEVPLWSVFTRSQVDRDISLLSNALEG